MTRCPPARFQVTTAEIPRRTPFPPTYESRVHLCTTQGKPEQCPDGNVIVHKPIPNSRWARHLMRSNVYAQTPQPIVLGASPLNLSPSNFPVISLGGDIPLNDPSAETSPDIVPFKFPAAHLPDALLSMTLITTSITLPRQLDIAEPFHSPSNGPAAT